MDKSGKNTVPRLRSLDALRGIAVILMVQQHLGVWLWNAPRNSLLNLFREYPLLMSVNWLGNLAAPLFITLSGIGVIYLKNSYKKPDMTLIKRGIIIILFGYLLNLIACHWFSIGSWFVLHLIGACLIVSPLLNRLRSSMLILISLLILVFAVMIQTWFNTPLFLRESRMIDMSMPGGVFRLALVEGHFPILPWCSFFIIGMVAGRSLIMNKLKPLLLIGGINITSGCLMTILYFNGYAFATYSHYFRFFVFLPYFFPALPPLLLFLNGTVLLLLSGALTINSQFHKSFMLPLITLGRASITILIVHTALFNEFSRIVGLYKKFDPTITFIIITVFIILCGLAVTFWREKNYIYGFEWLLRRTEY